MKALVVLAALATSVTSWDWGCTGVATDYPLEACQAEASYYQETCTGNCCNYQCVWNNGKWIVINAWTENC